MGGGFEGSVCEPRGLAKSRSKACFMDCMVGETLTTGTGTTEFRSARRVGLGKTKSTRAQRYRTAKIRDDLCVRDSSEPCKDKICHRLPGRDKPKLTKARILICGLEPSASAPLCKAPASTRT